MPSADTLPDPIPGLPTWPLGILKFRIYLGFPSGVVPFSTTSTEAGSVGSNVVVVPCSNIAGCPSFPAGNVRFRIYFGLPDSSVPSAMKLPEGVSPDLALTDLRTGVLPGLPVSPFGIDKEITYIGLPSVSYSLKLISAEANWPVPVSRHFRLRTSEFFRFLRFYLQVTQGSIYTWDYRIRLLHQQSR